MARKIIQSEPDEITSLGDFPIQLNMSVHYIRFAAHGDCPQTQKIIEQLMPGHVVTHKHFKNHCPQKTTNTFTPPPPPKWPFLGGGKLFF